jgi:hypothetical protein
MQENQNIKNIILINKIMQVKKLNNKRKNYLWKYYNAMRLLLIIKMICI